MLSPKKSVSYLAEEYSQINQSKEIFAKFIADIPRVVLKSYFRFEEKEQ